MKTKCSLCLWRSEDEREVRMGTFGVLLLFPEEKKIYFYPLHSLCWGFRGRSVVWSSEELKLDVSMMGKQIIPSIAHELCCENIDQAVIKEGAEKNFHFFFHFSEGWVGEQQVGNCFEFLCANFLREIAEFHDFCLLSSPFKPDLLDFCWFYFPDYREFCCENIDWVDVKEGAKNFLFFSPHPFTGQDGRTTSWKLVGVPLC